MKNIQLLSVKPRTFYSRAFSMTVLTGALLGLSAPAAFAETDKPQYRLIQLQADATREVANNQMEAVLFTELNSSSPTSLSQDITRTLNDAMRQAAKYPQVKVSTGAQSTYPVYDEKNKLKGWRARAQIELKSTDFKATSDLITALQDKMQVQSINFSVSDAERKRVENELMVEASQAFQQRAQLLQQSWQASGYELVNLDLNAMNNERPPIMYAMKARDASAAMESQNVQGGNSQMRVNASGSVQLR